jgi:hypothetical protein
MKKESAVNLRYGTYKSLAELFHKSNRNAINFADLLHELVVEYDGELLDGYRPARLKLRERTKTIRITERTKDFLYLAKKQGINRNEMVRRLIYSYRKKFVQSEQALADDALNDYFERLKNT